MRVFANSAHISYAMVYTPYKSRESIDDSIRSRRTYGATDNIVLDFRLGEALMGEELRAQKPQTIRATLCVSRQLTAA